MKKEPVFFVKTNYDHTNEVIARIVPGENFSEEKKAWRCSFKDVYALLRCRANQSLIFEVFVDFGDGELHPFKIQPPKRFQTIKSQMETRLAILRYRLGKQKAA